MYVVVNNVQNFNKNQINKKLLSGKTYIFAEIVVILCLSSNKH